MNLASTLEFNGQLDAVVTRANGVVEDHGTIGNSTISLDDAWKRVKNSKPFWNRLYLEVRDHMPLIFGAAALASAFYGNHLAAGQLALVTTAGINLLMADFVSGAGTHIARHNGKQHEPASHELAWRLRHRRDADRQRDERCDRLG